MKKVILLMLFVVVPITICLYFFVYKAFPRTGDHFANEGELTRFLAGCGYDKLGRFNPVWPAQITEVVRAKDKIEFRIANGTPQRYDSAAYAGYEFVFLRMQGTGKNSSEFGYVFRTKDK